MIKLVELLYAIPASYYRLFDLDLRTYCDYCYLQSAHLDGSGRQKLLRKNLHHLYSLSLLHDSLYWLDKVERNVFRVSLTGASFVYCIYG